MSVLGTALLEQLEEADLDRLAELLAPRLAGRPPAAEAGPAGYTVARLAAEVGLSGKTIRGAIHRGELRAVRRGSSYVIAADAVAEWLTPDDPPARPRPRARAAGPSRRPLADVISRPPTMPARRKRPGDAPTSRAMTEGEAPPMQPTVAPTRRPA